MNELYVIQIKDQGAIKPFEQTFKTLPEAERKINELRDEGIDCFMQVINVPTQKYVYVLMSNTIKNYSHSRKAYIFNSKEEAEEMMEVLYEETIKNRTIDLLYYECVKSSNSFLFYDKINPDRESVKLSIFKHKIEDA